MSDDAGFWNARQEVRFNGGSTLTVYQTDYAYVLIAIVMSLVVVLVVMPMFWERWRLRIEVGMSRMEIAKALEALLLEDVDDNGTAGWLARQPGRGEKLRYCNVDMGDAEGNTPGFRKRLQIWDTNIVRRPEVGDRYLHVGGILIGILLLFSPKKERLGKSPYFLTYLRSMHQVTKHKRTSSKISRFDPRLGRSGRPN